MAEPKKKLSASRSGKRRSKLALKTRQLVLCLKCKERTLPHRACGNCGYYKGKSIVKKNN